MRYFEKEKSIAYSHGIKTDDMIRAVASRYIGENPATPFVFHVISEDTFKQDKDDGRYIIDMNAALPTSQLNDYAYAAALIKTESAIKNFPVTINCFGSVVLYLNGEIVFKSSCVEEVNPQVKTAINLPLLPGDNTLFFKFQKQVSGFGCIFGSEYDTSNPKTYLSPFLEREGQAGFIFSESVRQDTFCSNIPDLFDSEKAYDIKWYPNMKWEDTTEEFRGKRIFRQVEGKYVVGYTKFKTNCCLGIQNYRIVGNCAAKTDLWIGDRCLAKEIEGDINIVAEVHEGIHSLVARTKCYGDYGFNLKVFDEKGNKCVLISPYNVKGTSDPWLYRTCNDNTELNDILKPYSICDGDFWRINLPNYYIRPFIKAARFGKWNYPLGVACYGLYRAGKHLGINKLSDYAKSHIDITVEFHRYSLWDKEKYGYSSVNSKLVELSMLDDCGSFGFAMLEVYRDTKEEKYMETAHIIADFIMNKIERQPDGAFYRKQRGVHYMTMWADDLYMSTPFLVRYYEATGNERFLNEAAKQFLLFKKYLFMTEHQLMSHVYDFKFNEPNRLPWGRGNGWVLFSLSELLEVMPKDHEHRDELVEFFRLHCEGIITCQSDIGLWHQILNDKGSYKETSCTSMFIYAFTRGLRLGLFKTDEYDKYCHAAKKGVEGLAKYSVDNTGNVYGVCWGSRYSFSSEYYTKQLLTAKNDNHGIGIVMLACIEFENMESFMMGGTCNE